MKWVLLFFCTILSIVFLLILLIIFSTIRLNIQKIHISNLNSVDKRILEKDYDIFLEVYLFGIIKIAKIRLDKYINKKYRTKIKFRDLNNNLKNTDISKIIKMLKIKICKFNLDTKIGTSNVITTAYVIAFISSLLGILLRNSNKKKTSFKITPLYDMNNSINFQLNCIISIKMIQIINTIYTHFQKLFVDLLQEKASLR